MRNIQEKELAIQLRQKGLSYADIMKQVPVCKSTLSGWLWEVELTPEQKSKLSERSRVQGRRGGEGHQQIWDKRRQQLWQEYNPPFDDPFFMLGLGLYWGEGTKKDKSTVCLVNTDVRVLQTYKRWIESYFVGEYTDFTIRLTHHRPKQDMEVRQYWSRELGVPLTNFIKSNFRASPTSQYKRGNIHPNGIAAVRVRGKGVWRIRQKIEKALQTMHV